MTPPPSQSGADRRRNVGAYIWIAIRLALGYVLAVAVGAVVLATSLEVLSNFQGLRWPHGGTTNIFERIVELAMLSFVLGAMFGLPYTIVGSLVFWFRLPRRATIFLLIGTFCPIGALLTMSPVFRDMIWLDAPILLFSLPAGLAAAYVYGAIGFARGFGIWRFQ
jgi:hypothetical protein